MSGIDPKLPLSECPIFWPMAEIALPASNIRQLGSVTPATHREYVMRMQWAAGFCIVLAGCGSDDVNDPNADGSFERGAQVNDEQARSDALKAKVSAMEAAFQEYRSRPDRIYGNLFPNAEFGRKLWSVHNRDNDDQFNYNSEQGRGPGGFTLHSAGRPIVGHVKDLSSDNHRGERIFVIADVITSENGRKKSYVLSKDERQLIANFFQTLGQLWRVRDQSFSRAHGFHGQADAIDRLPMPKASVVFDD